MCVLHNLRHVKGRFDKDTFAGRGAPIRREIRLNYIGSKSNQQRPFADYAMEVVKMSNILQNRTLSKNPGMLRPRNDPF